MTSPTKIQRHSRNEAVLADLRAHGGRTAGGQVLVVLKIIGPKSGRIHDLPVCVREDGRDLVVVASAGGQPLHPEWYENLMATPDISVEYLGEIFAVHATTVPNGLDRDRLVKMMSREVTGLYSYQDRCRDQRQIPIIRLTRI